jgi:8-oxo-dGTP pyrophosphatase MutT (NUDIX family)
MFNPPFGSPEEKNWSVEDQEELTRNAWFRVLKSRVKMPDDRDTTYFTVDYLKGAVGVVARREKEILLIRQYRFIIDDFVWAIPSGGVEKGEDLVAAAGRELFEESGYRAKAISKLMSYYPSYGSGNQEFHLFLAEEVSAEPGPFDANEVLEVRWFPEDEVKRMILAGHMVDGLSLTPLLLLFAREGSTGASP